VVLTMLASLSFDPKLTWDSPEAQAAGRNFENREEQTA